MPITDSVFVAIIILDLTVFHTWFLTAFGFLALLATYIWYRREAVLNERASSQLRDNMVLEDVKKIENKYSCLEGFQTPDARAQSRPPLERYFYHLRYKRVQGLLDQHARDAKRILDMGCGFGKNTLYLQRELNIPAFGIDLDFNKLKFATMCKKTLNCGDPSAYVTADASRPPFQSGCFDCILMTEVLEHLIRPREGLAAANMLLAQEGLLIITTPSRHDLAYTVNPFRILEKLLSLAWDCILPPYHHLHERREYDRRNPAPQYGMHYHFSYQELRALLLENGFQTIYWKSFEVEFPLFPVIACIARGELEQLETWIGPLENMLESMPLVNLLGQHLVFVARKVRKLDKSQQHGEAHSH